MRRSFEYLIQWNIIQISENWLDKLRKFLVFSDDVHLMTRGVIEVKEAFLQRDVPPNYYFITIELGIVCPRLCQNLTMDEYNIDICLGSIWTWKTAGIHEFIRQKFLWSFGRCSNLPILVRHRSLLCIKSWCKTWTLNTQQKFMLDIFERKVLRGILGWRN